MARIKIALPPTLPFITHIPIRITDLNYGGHVGNDTILSLVHEARMLYLRSRGFSELDAGGAGLIMSDAAIEFKQEIFYGDLILVAVGAAEFSRVGFDLFYHFEKETEGKRSTAAIAKTGMICYDYTLKKVIAVPEILQNALQQNG